MTSPRRPSIAFGLAVLAILSGAPAQAQTAPSPPVTEATPAAPADEASIDAIIAALYDVISGEAGAPRDWDRFASLFYPGAVMAGTSLTPEGRPRARIVAPADYAARNAPYFADHAFFEHEIGRKTDRFGPIAHVLSAYESRDAAAAPEPFERGVNSLQLFHDGTRWWVMSIVWAGETPDNPLPAEWLTAPAP